MLNSWHQTSTNFFHHIQPLVEDCTFNRFSHFDIAYRAYSSFLYKSVDNALHWWKSFLIFLGSVLLDVSDGGMICSPMQAAYKLLSFRTHTVWHGVKWFLQPTIGYHFRVSDLSIFLLQHMPALKFSEKSADVKYSATMWHAFTCIYNTCVGAWR